MAGHSLPTLIPGSRVEPAQPLNQGPEEERPLDLGEGFDPVARQAIEIGEQALTDLRKNTVARWISAGAAWRALQNVAMNRSGSNTPVGNRYNRVYGILVHAWPQLAKVDKATRSHAIWLFTHQDDVLAWLLTLSQKERDAWTHPSTLRRHYERRHPNLLPEKRAAYKPRPPIKRHQAWNRQSLRDRSREDLDMLIGELGEQLADRDREILEKDALIENLQRENAQLRDDLAWAHRRIRQLEGIVTPPVAATVVRPDGEAAEIVHAVTRASQEVLPPLSFGYPDYHAWARIIASRITKLSAIELQWLLDDNRIHFDAYERAHPGAGRGLEGRINARIAELEAADRLAL
jgi:hypothetical protein